MFPRLLPLAFGLLISVKVSALSSLKTVVFVLAFSPYASQKCFQDKMELRDAVRSYQQETTISLYGHIEKWCFDASVDDMSGLFAWATSFNENISGWDMSNVKDTSYMFYGASHFNQDLSDWDLRNVQEMSSMFMWSFSFNQDLCPWGARIRSDAKVTRLFYGSNCTQKGAPDLHANPPGPFCHVCTTSSPSKAPTKHPTSSSPTQRPSLAPSLSLISEQAISIAFWFMGFSLCGVALCIVTVFLQCQKWGKKNEELHQRRKELADLINDESSKDLPPPTVVAVAAQDPSLAEAGPKEFPEEGRGNKIEFVPSGYEERVWFG